MTIAEQCVGRFSNAAEQSIYTHSGYNFDVIDVIWKRHVGPAVQTFGGVVGRKVCLVNKPFTAACNQCVTQLYKLVHWRCPACADCNLHTLDILLYNDIETCTGNILGATEYIRYSIAGLDSWREYRLI